MPSSAVLLPLIDDSENLFQRIISESGSLSLTFSMEESEKSSKELIKKWRASNMQDLLALSEDEIKKIHNENSSYDCFAIRDGYILTEDLYQDYKSGKGKDIDMLLGSNKDETRYFILSMEEITNYFKAQFFYFFILMVFQFYMKIILEKWVQKVPMNKLSEYHSDTGGNTYVYIWKFPGKDETLGACHTIEYHMYLIL